MAAPTINITEKGRHNMVIAALLKVTNPAQAASQRNLASLRTSASRFE
jgi:hypothetical protein